ncbi:hypothetical protein H072_4059 [Dactylellina haptotyla CBS 200.50]|uniref:Myb-like DNA-binding domain-containing protein n=1 Tax=Dactylellina haptotyla (strain CBS 200.50) TaxID=1284197 RepID=S8BRE6_DACHA|nr:hypothetical protein H072_4059 [Dactylellina haptotyla CBS 200.50]
MSRHHPAPNSDTMKELILMQAIINAYNLPPKFELAAKALKITTGAVSSRYSRLKKKIEAAGALYPLFDVGPDGKPIKRGRGRPPRKAKLPMSTTETAIVATMEDDEEDDEEMIDAPSTNGKSSGFESKKLDFRMPEDIDVKVKVEDDLNSEEESESLEEEYSE